jgi:hypothetical protein
MPAYKKRMVVTQVAVTGCGWWECPVAQATGDSIREKIRYYQIELASLPGNSSNSGQPGEPSKSLSEVMKSEVSARGVLEPWRPFIPVVGWWE